MLVCTWCFHLASRILMVESSQWREPINRVPTAYRCLPLHVRKTTISPSVQPAIQPQLCKMFPYSPTKITSWRHYNSLITISLGQEQCRGKLRTHILDLAN